jgi:hypothetical protein
MRRVLFAEGSQENVSSNTGVVPFNLFSSMATISLMLSLPRPNQYLKSRLRLATSS